MLELASVIGWIGHAFSTYILHSQHGNGYQPRRSGDVIVHCRRDTRVPRWRRRHHGRRKRRNGRRKSKAQDNYARQDRSDVAVTRR